jgi:hypothetical protein
MDGLADIEDRLRFATANEALEELRRQLHMRTFASKYKKRNVRSQGPYTRMKTLQLQIENKISTARDRYRTSWQAFLSLRGKGVWEETLRELVAGDIRAMNERMLTAEEAEANRRMRALAGVSDDEDRNIDVAPSRIIDVGEGHRTLSWIWYSVQGAEVEMDVSGTMHACIRVEWAKARARALRWREEIFLLDEKMCRVLAFGEWKARWWLEQATRRDSVSEELAEDCRHMQQSMLSAKHC